MTVTVHTWHIVRKQNTDVMLTLYSRERRPSSLSGDTSGSKVDKAVSSISLLLRFSSSIEHSGTQKWGSGWERAERISVGKRKGKLGALQSIWSHSHISFFQPQRPTPSSIARSNKIKSFLTRNVNKKFLQGLPAKDVSALCPDHCDINSAKHYLL